MLQHGNHILDNLEFADNNGNHYLSNGVGLLFLGVAARRSWRRPPPGARRASRSSGARSSTRSTPTASTSSRASATRAWWPSSGTRACCCASATAIAVPPLVRERLGRMFEFMLAYTRPDGTFPQIGDNDDGRLANLDDEPVGSHQPPPGGRRGDVRPTRPAGRGRRRASRRRSGCAARSVLTLPRDAARAGLAGLRARRLLRHALARRGDGRRRRRDRHARHRRPRPQRRAVVRPVGGRRAAAGRLGHLHLLRPTRRRGRRCAAPPPTTRCASTARTPAAWAATAGCG